MLNTSIALLPDSVVAPVNRRTFGGFVEHMGRCVYTGIYEPDHPSADEDVFVGTCSTWCVMTAINLGTRGVQEAIDLLEYCNHPEATYLSDLRRRHGAEEPYGMRTWCLGNEMDGPWQLRYRSANECGRLAAMTAQALRRFDSGLELVGCAAPAGRCRLSARGRRRS